MKTNKQITAFLKLKNNKEEDIYSIDKLDDTLIISPLKRHIDIFEPLTLYSLDEDLCTINMSEVFVDTLVEAIEKNQIDKKNVSKIEQIAENSIEAIDAFVKYKKLFREMSECFPDAIVSDEAYVEPDVESILRDINVSDQATNLYLKINGSLKGNESTKLGDSKPYVRETPKVSVNDPCPCGSGKKYKQCCKS